jgi:hypothetical protein
MNPTEKKIEAIKNNGYELDFGTVLNDAFANYKKNALFVGLALLIFCVIFGFFSVMIAISFYGFSSNFTDLEAISGFKISSFPGTTIVFSIFVASFFTAIFTPFLAGFLKVADLAAKNQEFTTAAFFGYYKSPYFVSIFIASMLLSLVSMSLSTLLETINMRYLGTVSSLIISAFTFLYIPLIIFGNLKPLDAIKGSLILVFKQPLVIIGLLIVAFIAAMSGFVGCCIGIFFTIPFVYSMQYTIYASIVGVDSLSELDEIGYKQKIRFVSQNGFSVLKLLTPLQVNHFSIRICYGFHNGFAHSWVWVNCLEYFVTCSF